MTRVKILAILVLIAILGAAAAPAAENAAAGSVTPLSGAAAIQGLVRGKKKECNGRVQTWVSQGKTLLYQTEIPLGGSFEFHLVPGKYNVVATGATGCFAETSFELGRDEVRAVELDLTRAKARAPASAGKGHP